MQSTVLDNIPETHRSLTEIPENIITNLKQSNAPEMQLIPQKSLKENEEPDTSISSSPSDSILSESNASPSRSKGADFNMPESNCISNGDGSPEADSNGKIDEELNVSHTFRTNGDCDSLNPPDTPHGPTGRPANATSDSSSRTSRESGYFSCSSANESPPLQLQANGIEILVDSSKAHDTKEVENKTVKQIEPVPEEAEEEDVKNTSEHQTQDFADKNHKIENSLNSATPNSKEQNRSRKETNKENNNCDFQGKLPISKRNDRVSVKDINKKLGELDHLAPTASMAMDASFQLTYVDRVILELIETERMYVRALEDILAGYILAIKYTPGLPISTSDAMKLFGNIKDIYAFNRKFLSCLENCESDPVQVGYHFVSQDASFSVYTEYCTHYPISVSLLTRCMKNSVLAHFFKSQQESLRHTLPLGAYLLKPVQRILKYHLILQEMVKHCDKNLENLSIIKQALATMTFIAQHINDMKRKHEDAVHIQELQSLLTNWPGDDLTTYGKIVMEGDLKLQGAKNDRLVFLFDKMMLITKRREDGFLVCKTHIMCSDLILLESVKENPLSFLISPFDTPSFHANQHSTRTFKQFILTTRYPDEKKLWTQNIKRQILKNHHAAIPLQAQQSIMNMGRMKLNGSASKSKRGPAKIFSNTLTPATAESSTKHRRQSDSVATRKTLPLKTAKKKQENETHDDSVSKSNPEQATSTPTKSRFSIPWINKSSPKHEPAVLSPSRVTSPTPEKAEKARPVVEEKKEEKEEKDEKRFVKKRERGSIRRNERHKESVIYKRYKRRKSQPVTSEIERLMKEKDSSASPLPEEKEEKKSTADLSIDDFDTFEDFLSSCNTRDSVSWDVQIVEAVFDRFKKEEENHKDDDEKLPNEEMKDPIEDPVIISVPTIEKLKETSDVSDIDELQKTVGYDSNETLISESVDESTPTEDLASVDDDDYRPKMSPQTSYEMIKDENEMVLTVSVVDPPTNESATWEKEYIEASPILDASDLDTVMVHSAEETDDYEDIVKDDAGEASIPVSPSTKIKRSQSTQSACHERRRYFEKLKEIRDRRHSNVSLNSYDANHIIQSGKVRNMIAQHRDYVASHVKYPPSHNKYNHYDMEEMAVSKQEKSNRLGADLLAMPQSGHYRRQRSSVTSESSHCDDTSRASQYTSMDMDAVHNSRFSTLTTGSLPLNFTSSSNSSSCSSINDSEDHHCTSPNTPKYKVLLQPRLFLWKSQFDGIRPNTKRNFALPTPLQLRHGHKHHSHTKHRDKVDTHHNPERHHDKIPSYHDAKQDSSDEDDWEDFETKAQKFETLCRSSSSEKLREKHTLKRSSFRTWKDLASSSFHSAPKPTFKQVQSKFNNELTPNTNPAHTPTIKTTRLRFKSNRSSTSETESASTATSASVSRSSSYRSTTTNKATTSFANTSMRLNERNRNDSLSSSTSSCVTQPTTPTSPTPVSVKRSSSYRSREPVGRSNSPVASPLSRHSSMTCRDRNSPAKGRVSELENTSANLKRSSSCRTQSQTPQLPNISSTDTVIVRRTSSRRRRKTHPLTSKASSIATSNLVTVASTSKNAKTFAGQATTASTNVTSTSNLAATTPSNQKTTAGMETTASTNPKTALVRQSSIASTTQPIETPSSSSETVELNTSETEAHQCDPENKSNECCVKGVLKLAQRFDEMAQSTGNSNLLTGRNRLNKGRKHHSDLALPFANETSKSHIDFGIAKKQAQLKRHQSCVTARSLQSRETPLIRRFSEALFLESNHQSSPAAAPVPLKPVTFVRSSSANSIPTVEKPALNLPQNDKADKISLEPKDSTEPKPKIMAPLTPGHKAASPPTLQVTVPVAQSSTQPISCMSPIATAMDSLVQETADPKSFSSNAPQNIKESASLPPATTAPHCPSSSKNGSSDPPKIGTSSTLVLETDSSSSLPPTRTRTRTNRKAKATGLSPTDTSSDNASKPSILTESQSPAGLAIPNTAPKSRTRVRAHRNRKSIDQVTHEAASTKPSKVTPTSAPKNNTIDSPFPESTPIVTSRIRARVRRKIDPSADELTTQNPSSTPATENPAPKVTSVVNPSPLEVDDITPKVKTTEQDATSTIKDDSCSPKSPPPSKSRSSFSQSSNDSDHSSTSVESLSKSSSNGKSAKLEHESIKEIAKTALSRKKPSPPTDFVALFCKI